MKLCDQYLKDMVEVNPTMNDLYEFSGYERLKGIMINPYTDDYKQRELEILKKYVPAYPIESIKLFKLILFNYLFSNGDAHFKMFFINRNSIRRFSIKSRI